MKLSKKFGMLTLAAGLSLAAHAAPTTTNTTPAAAPASAPAPTTTSSILKTEEDKISYSIGIDLGKNFQQQDIKVVETPFMQGIKDGQSGAPTLMTEQELKTTLTNLQKNLVQKQVEAAQKLATKNTEEGAKFLAEYKTKPDVKSTASGLLYRIIKTGTGASPKATDMVTTHYRGTFTDGKEFDSSYSRGEPAQFQVNGVIPGWTEVLQLMQPGAKYEVVVPANLAYGENGVGRIIGPNATLVFEIELLNIQNKAEQPAAPKAAAKTAPQKPGQKTSQRKTTTQKTTG
jgi:FKBP-type peptidyl-prolyl cis-trans isomerase FklB